MVQDERIIVGFVELFLIGVGLSMDAFAVSVCKGLGMSRLNIRQATIISLFFGGFQALMPLIGWALGSQLADLITPIDHWIAFALLAFVGGKMLWDAFHEDDEQGEEAQDARLDLKELIMLAIATSIDALAVGVTFAFLRVNIVPAVSFIGCITFLLSAIGLKAGNIIGAKNRSRAEFAGGLVLILMGIKILLEHLGVISF